MDDDVRPDGDADQPPDPLGRTTTITRDGYHNPTRLQYADGSVVTQVWGYGGSSFDTTGAKRKLQR